jgi:hypothetical protein
MLRSLFSATVCPPATSTGQAICCSYHLIGRNFSDCHDRASHKVMSSTDMTTLCEFVQTHVVIPDIGRASAPN